MSVVNIAQKLSLFSEYWNPKIVGEFNNQKIQVVKLKGEFVWHSHQIEDEMFLVIKGTLKINFRDKVETINVGEFITIPHGVEHKPEAEEEVHIVLIEPIGTVNTGDAKDSVLTAKEINL
jgi:mannose-6-phosphate isomerase-like protein (cupin superfamily)